MNCRFMIVLLVCLFYSSSYAQDWSDYQGSDIYPVPDKKDCAPKFLFHGVEYNDCTIADGSNGDYPWCSLTYEYNNLIAPCYDFRNTTIQCLPSFTMPGGKVYDKCDYLSPTAPYKQCKTNNPVIKYRYCTDAISSAVKPSINRTASCPKEYLDISKNHTMCFGPSLFAIPVPLNSTEIKDVLDMHNSYRSNVSSEYMFMLQWDDELTKMAQQHSNLCVFEHDLAINRIIPKYGWKNGQNIVMSSEFRSSPASLIDMMLGSEKPNFRYGDTCYPGENTCLHYTQAMLSNITHVGCGQTHCVYPDRIERYITCNYIQSQYSNNYNTPYVPSDTPGSKCPNNRVNGLCNCPNKICDYHEGVDEYLDPNTCQCRSPYNKRSIDESASNLDAILDEELQNQAPVLSIKPEKGLAFSKRHIKTLKIAPGKRSMEKRYIKTLKIPSGGK